MRRQGGGETSGFTEHEYLPVRDSNMHFTIHKRIRAPQISWRNFFIFPDGEVATASLMNVCRKFSVLKPDSSEQNSSVLLPS